MNTVAFNRGWGKIESDLHGMGLSLFRTGRLQRGDKSFEIHGTEILEKLRATFNDRLEGKGILADDEAEIIALGGPWLLHLQGFADSGEATAILHNGRKNFALVGRKMIAAVSGLLNRAFEEKQP